MVTRLGRVREPRSFVDIRWLGVGEVKASGMSSSSLLSSSRSVRGEDDLEQAIRAMFEEAEVEKGRPNTRLSVPASKEYSGRAVAVFRSLKQGSQDCKHLSPLGEWN